MDLSVQGLPPYAIAPHVYPCRVNRHVILLDLKRDRYFGVSPPASDDLAELIDSWPTSAPPNQSPQTDSQRREASTDLISEMLVNGMLTTELKKRAPRGKLIIGTPVSALIDNYEEVHTRIRSTDVAYFFHAISTAAYLRRRYSLERIAARIRRARASFDKTPASKRVPFDASHARPLAALFKRLRPLLFTAFDECLFDSLAQREFLAHYRLFPRLVFGVAADPFAAHCWLQQDDVVINDTLDQVRRYTPIMAL